MSVLDDKSSSSSSSSSSTMASSNVGWLSKPVRALLLDITGVLYESGTTYAIKGSLEAIQKIRNAGIPFRLVTNETQKVTSKLVEKLSKFGYDFKPEEIITPAMICCHYLRKNNLKPHFLVYPDLLPEFEEFQLKDGEPNCVVIGDADRFFTFEAMNKCFQLLMSLKDQKSIICNGQQQKQHQQQRQLRDDLLISLGYNKYYREKGQLKLDLGAFTKALEYSSDLKAKIIGKPSGDYFQSAIDSIIKTDDLLINNKKEISKDEIVMIGDDIVGDVYGAQNFGLRGVLVRTGKYMPSCENHPTIKPDAIVDNLECAIDQILKHRK